MLCVQRLFYFRRDHTTAVKWITTKSNTEFFSTSTDGRAMWWDTRKLRAPTEVLVFDLQVPDEQRMDRAIGISSANFEPSVSTRFLFGLENGIAISGSRKARTPAEKLALRFDAHYGPVASVDRNGLNPKIFLTVGNSTASVWAEDTRDDSLISTRYCFFFSFTFLYLFSLFSLFHLTAKLSKRVTKS